MNINDSAVMAVSMQQNGFTETGIEHEANVVIYNTCSVRKHAEDRAKARIIESKAHAKKRQAIVVVTGCMARRIGEELLAKKYADIAIGPYQSPQIGSIILQYYKDPRQKLFISDDKNDFKKRLHPALANHKEVNPWHKWVTITHGCENFCTYCIVPYVRGKLISFSSKSILEYINILPDQGIKEITLLGQNVNQYGQDNNEIPFYKLLEKIAAIKGIEKINFLTSHPKDFNYNIINVIKDNPNMSRAIHLPLQSASDNILKAMNRKYTLSHYMNIIDRLEKILTEYSISTDLIVGFPGETENDFQAILDAVNTINFDNAFMYAYSPRSGTAAFNFKETLSDQEKIVRLQKLINLQRKICLNKLKKRIGKNETVFIERISKKSETEVMGKSFLNHSVVIPGSALDIGKKIVVRISGIKGSTLYGKRI